MAEAFKVKLRQIGTSAGVIIPQEILNEIGLNIGDEIQVAILPKRKDFSGFGMAKNAKIPFKRDKKVREFA
ncbi:MAG TPA: hypothetical protein VJG30_01815 [Candidatus Nanoarchaeia archaeon]|nr:hypothetical protein [Candidatus Nanoarchaeia archaeon]